MLKDEVYLFLNQKVGEFVSGEELSLNLKKSRTAIWKAVESLRKDGYEIEAVTNRGYRLSESCDAINKGVIERLITQKGVSVDVYKEVTSTLDLGRNYAVGGGEGIKVIVAESQTEGRGRFKRKFYSPKGGLYMTIVFRPKRDARTNLYITAEVAVAVLRAVKEICKTETRIKWVNDLYKDGKKVCGILTEAQVNLESGTTDFVAIGIGINVVKPEGGFADEIKDKAGYISINEGLDVKNRLVAKIVSEFFDIYEREKLQNIRKEYDDSLAFKGEEVEVVLSDESFVAKEIGITEDFGLIVETESGKKRILNYGDVTLKNK